MAHSYKILVLYFSGTGNTAFIAKKLYQRLKADNSGVTLASIETFPFESVADYDVLYFGFPVYACDMPLPVQRYCEKLTLPTSKRVILFSTMGIYGGNANRIIAKRFLQRGMTTSYALEIPMPGSDGLVFLKENSRYAKKLRVRDFENDRAILKAVALLTQALELETEKLPPFRLGGMLASFFMQLAFRPIERIFKKKFWANDSCIGCRLCELNCPMKNISVSATGVFFHDSCFLCMRCINQCPVKAIQIGSMTDNTFRWKGPEKIKM
jgi:ferredoxin/flavodoxin